MIFWLLSKSKWVKLLRDHSDRKREKKEGDVQKDSEKAKNPNNSKNISDIGNFNELYINGMKVQRNHFGVFNDHVGKNEKSFGMPRNE